MAETWPNLFIVGAPRAGTTSLYHYLRAHPQVFLPHEKEPHFFSDTVEPWPGADPDPERLAWYLGLFRDATEPVVGEASTSYLSDPRAPERIRRFAGEARILVSLRDPVERCFSYYLHHTRLDPNPPALLDLVGDQVLADLPDAGNPRFLRESATAPGLERYVETFGRDRVHALLLPRLKREPRETLGEIAAFLEVDPAPFDAVEADVVFNAYGQPRNRLANRIRKSLVVQRVARALFSARMRRALDDRFLQKRAERPQMDEATRRRLQELFAPDVDALEALLGRELPELRASWV